MSPILQKRTIVLPVIAGVALCLSVALLLLSFWVLAFALRLEPSPSYPMDHIWARLITFAFMVSMAMTCALLLSWFACRYPRFGIRFPVLRRTSWIVPIIATLDLVAVLCCIVSYQIDLTWYAGQHTDCFVGELALLMIPVAAFLGALTAAGAGLLTWYWLRTRPAVRFLLLCLAGIVFLASCYKLVVIITICTSGSASATLLCHFLKDIGG